MLSKGEQGFIAWMNDLINDWPRCPECQALLTWCSLIWHDHTWSVRWTCGEHVWIVPR